MTNRIARFVRHPEEALVALAVTGLVIAAVATPGANASSLGHEGDSAPSDSHVTTAPAWIDAAPINPCQWEDGSDSPRPCYWDSDAMGNGTGNGVTLYGPDGSIWHEGTGDVEWVQVTD